MIRIHQIVRVVLPVHLEHGLREVFLADARQRVLRDVDQLKVFKVYHLHLLIKVDLVQEILDEGLIELVSIERLSLYPEFRSLFGLELRFIAVFHSVHILYRQVKTHVVDVDHLVHNHHFLTD